MTDCEPQRLKRNFPKIPVVTIIQLTQDLKNEAQRLGFVLAGVAPAAEPARLHAFHQWLEQGFAGEMHYLETRAEAYRHPSHVLDGCRSLLMLALPYRTVEPPVSPQLQEADARAEIARYAAGEMDYHDVIHDRLKQLKTWLESARPGAMVRGVVDTAPLLEREFAEAAGLGWVGKNTLLLNRQWGSYFFLAALLTDLELAVDAPQEKGYCGTCTACLDACPTDAFTQPYVLDARRCLSYLTIEHRGAVDDELARHFDQWVFGCDICQEVCPWNRKAALSTEATFKPREDLIDLTLHDLLRLNDAEFRERFRHTPMWRSKRRGMLRNALLSVGARGLDSLRSSVEELLHDDEAIIRDAAAWALRQLDANRNSILNAENESN